MHGLHTAFDGCIGDLAGVVTSLGFRLHRMEASACDDATMVAMVREAQSVGATPLVVAWRLEQLPHLAGVDVEWKNELDGDVAPEAYRAELNEAVRIATEHGVRLWGGVISNLDGDSLKWLNDVKGDGWPAGLFGVTAHRYGDGTFDEPHRGFKNRDSEVKWLRAAAGDLPVMVTEFGYPTVGLSEHEAAVNIGKEWEFWGRHQIPAYLYQINDGPSEWPIDHFGIRRTDGTWKPAAFTVPQQESQMALKPEAALSRAQAIPQANGCFTSPHPDNDGTVLAVNPQGGIEKRPTGTAGPYELWKPEGSKAVFRPADGVQWAILLVD